MRALLLWGLLLAACGDDAAWDEDHSKATSEPDASAATPVVRVELDAALLPPYLPWDGKVREESKVSMLDAALAPALDAALVSETDATPPVNASVLAPELLPACPVENACPLAAYPCVVSDDGAGYSCRGQYAAWPMPDVDPHAKYAPSYSIDKVRDVVLDEVTGLLWQHTLPKMYSGCTGAVQTTKGDACSLQEARAYCAGLTSAAERWRLPSKIELESLLRIGNDQPGEPFIDIEAFPDTPLDLFWTDSPGLHPGVVDKYFAVSFGAATTDALPPTRYQPVRCVHSAHNPNAPPRHQTVDATAQTMRDAHTGLQWNFRLASTPIESAQRAGELCQSLGNYRLPAYKELLTLADVTRTDRATDPAIWKYQNEATWVWSSTRTPFDAMLYVPLIGLGLGASVLDGPGAVLCVR